jgi:hypothetical protein
MGYLKSSAIMAFIERLKILLTQEHMRKNSNINENNLLFGDSKKYF